VARVTPTQLRAAFAAVVRLGSVKRAAADLRVTESAVSLHVGQLRKELGDKLFTRSGAGIAFTPGGLRLARLDPALACCRGVPAPPRRKAMSEDNPSDSLGSPDESLGGPDVDAAVANAEEGSQVEGEHTPSVRPSPATPGWNR